MEGADEEEQWRCIICEGKSGKERYSKGSKTCKDPGCRRLYTERRVLEKKRAREQGGPPVLGKCARQGDPGPSAAAGYAALIASKRCVRIKKVSAAPPTPMLAPQPLPLSRAHPSATAPPPLIRTVT